MVFASVALIALAAISAEGNSSGVVRFGAVNDSSCTLRLSLDGSRLWPAPAAIRLVGLEGSEPFDAALTARETAALHRIIIPPGRYRLEIRALHHRGAAREIVAPPGGQVLLGEIQLTRLAVVRGAVRFRGKAVADAAIDVAGKTLGTTRRDGTFEIELPETGASLISVAKRPFGTKSVPLPRFASDLTLPAIEMARAASLQVRRGWRSGSCRRRAATDGGGRHLRRRQATDRRRCVVQCVIRWSRSRLLHPRRFRF